MIVGFATGFAQVVQLSPVEGLQEKVPAPTPLRVVELPIQIDLSAPALTAGMGNVVIVIISVLVQLLSVTTNVYVVLAVGEATGFEMFGLLKLAAGDQLYVVPPLPFSVVFIPGQTVTSGPAFATGAGPTKTCTVSIFTQVVAAEVVTVYVVVEVGEATGFATVVLFNPAAGLQLYVEPGGPVGLPPIVTEPPTQIV